MADRFNISISNDRPRSEFALNLNKGVDFQRSKLNVDTNHATNIKNIVYRDKTNQKRHGYENISQHDGKIYDIWIFNGAFIVHVGDKLYKLNSLEERIFENTTPISSDILVSEKQLKAFENKGALYILGGTAYLVLKSDFSLHYVEDDIDTYIPRTTIGITYTWQAKNTDDDKEFKDTTVGQRTALDDVNLLTMWRRNGLVSNTYVESSTSYRLNPYYDYELDTNVKCKSPEQNELKDILITIDYIREVEQ